VDEHEEQARFEESVMPHLDAAYNLARWLTRNEHDAQDVVQDAFVRALKFFGGFRGGNSRSWLLTIVRNTCYSWLEKNRKHELVTAFDEDLHAIEDNSHNPELLLLKDADRVPLRSDRVTFGGWRRGPWYVLDGTHPAVQNHFEHVFKTMRAEWGCTYFKLDANFKDSGLNFMVVVDNLSVRATLYKKWIIDCALQEIPWAIAEAFGPSFNSLLVTFALLEFAGHIEDDTTIDKILLIFAIKVGRIKSQWNR